MPTSGGAYIPITASRKQIFHEIKQLMGNGGQQAASLLLAKLEQGEEAGRAAKCPQLAWFYHIGTEYLTGL